MIRQVRPEDRQAIESNVNKAKIRLYVAMIIPPLFLALQRIAHDFYGH